MSTARGSGPRAGASPRRRPAPEQETRASPAALRRLAVLWVGAERDEAARLARAVRRGDGVELAVETVPAVAVARPRLAARVFDVVIAGPAIAEGDGPDVVADLVTAARRVPVVVLDARETGDDAEAMIAAGAVDHVFASTPERLLQAVERAALRARVQAARERARIAELSTDDGLRRVPLDERALVFAEQRARVSGLMAATFEGIAIHENGRIVEVNEVFAKMFGHTPDELLGSDIFLLAAPERRDDVRRRVLTRDEGPYETLGLRSDGTRFDLEVRGRSQTIGGRPLRVAAVRDVTQHKRLLGRLAESEERLRLIAANTTDLISRHDVGFRFVYASPASFRLLGLEPTHLEGRSLAELVHPDDAGIVERARRSLLDGEAETTIQYRMRADQGERWFETTVRALLDGTGGPLGFIAVSRDISGRVRQERVLARLAAQNRLILESAGQGICGVNLKGNLTFLNAAACRMLGVRARDLIGRPLHDVVHPAGCGGSPCRLATAIESRACASAATRFVRRQGGDLPVHAVVSPVTERGEVIGAVVVFDDVTERERAEEALRLRTEELEAFAYAVSHDLKTPIVSLDWLVQDLRERLPPGEPHVDATLERMMVNIHHADRLVRDLLDLAHVGNERPLDEHVDLGALVADVMDGLGESIVPRRIVTRVGRLPTVMGPEPRLRQVLENLMGNAVKYVEDGGVVQVDWRRDGDTFHVEVEDDGPGVAPTDRDRIFRLFERAPRRGGRDVAGSGMGLAIARRVARRLDGDLSVADGALGGARFRFTLPATRLLEETD